MFLTAGMTCFALTINLMHEALCPSGLYAMQVFNFAVILGKLFDVPRYFGAHLELLQIGVIL